VAKGLDPALIGRSIAGKFVIDSYIGAGAMGAVYKAKQVALDKVIALKVLHRELTADEAFTSRFKREAKAASRLDHPNSVRVIDFGIEPDGLMYIAMELLDGRDLLRVLVDDWPLSGPRIASILMQTLAALTVAHDMGVVHRDLKPENIMILKGQNDEGQAIDIVKVCDFGIAKLTEVRNEKVSQAGGPLTGQGLVVGTPEYMSPEQGRGDSLDLRSDLYSIGVILYQLLTGRVPFEAESALGIVLKHVTEEPIRPSTINPTIDLRLESICLKAMSKRREDRYQGARMMRTELRSVLGGSDGFVLPQSVNVGADDTAPMPLMPKDRSSGALPEAASSDPSLVARSSGAPAVSAPQRPELAPKTTSSATAFLDERARPSRSPPPALIGFALAALAAVLVAAVVIHRGGSANADVDPHSSATALATTTATAPAATGNDEDVALPVATGSAASAEPAASAPGAPSASAAGATHVPHSHTGASPQPPQPATATAGKTSFDLATASANASVAHVEGASARDVRAALPGAGFTQCYRDALKRGNHRIEGKMTVHITIGTDGAVSLALASAPETLGSSLVSCITTSFNRLPIPNASPGGGTADVSVVFVPE
jgi:eukaryotic-like serine/threonine-protein kinase